MEQRQRHSAAAAAAAFLVLLYVCCSAVAMERLKAAESQTLDVIVHPGRAEEEGEEERGLKNSVWRSGGMGVGVGGGERLRPRGEDDRRRAGVTQPDNLSDIHSKSNHFDGHLKTGSSFEGREDFEISVPFLANDVGEFLSYDVTRRRHHARRRRRRHRRKRSHGNGGRNDSAAAEGDDDAASGDDVVSPVFYRLSAFGREFQFNVSRNERLLAPSYAVEFWKADGAKEERHHFNRECIYTGHIVHEESTSRVALTNCGGLLGVFATESEEFFVEPLWNDDSGGTLERNGEEREGEREGEGKEEGKGEGEQKGQRHVIYRRIVANNEHDEKRFDCGTEDRLKEMSLQSNMVHSDDEDDHSKASSSSSSSSSSSPRGDGRRRRTKRAFSRENFVETLVVVDGLMAKYHGVDAIESYVLTVMTVVAKLFRDATIGNDVNIVVSKIIVLTEQQKDLEITYHADRTLETFCRWQNANSRSASGDGRSNHDTAILITRLDICLHQNQPCGTLGLAPVGGMCDPMRSCSFIEDIGIATAYTIAHELGHSFGMQHDGTLNTCGQSSEEPAQLMAFQLTKNTEPFTWSRCSRDYITAFLDSGKGDCLRDSPDQDELKENRIQSLPGQIHSADVQCKYQFGPKSAQCTEDVLDICRELWCLNPSNHCVTNSIPAAEGTPCSSTKVKLGWCYRGSCMKIDWRPKTINGQWGDWSPWSSCTRSCGGGVATSERSCSNPRPEHGGKYCIGERRRYRSCNILDCPANSTDFREIQCAKFNDELFRGKYYKWKPFTGGTGGKDWKPCALTCMAVNHHFYTERAAKVIDGTRCYHDSMDMCIDGKCEHVGCDGVLGSNATEDKCRVCGGDGRNCNTIRGTFDKEVDIGGESYVEAVKIPKGAMNILVVEKNLSHNYFALKSEGPDGKYYVNGEWTIDWPRQFEIANTSINYERPKDKPESIQALGPTSEDLTVMLLLQEKNTGVLYEFSMTTLNATASADDYVWQYGEWSECTTTCGRGLSQQKAICVNRRNSKVAVDKRNCRSSSKYEDKMKFCSESPCPPEWQVGNWTECSKTCGGGWKFRQVSCIQKIDQVLNEVSGNKNCSTKKPKLKQRCNSRRCPSQWKFDEWSKCRPSCGNGTRTRNVHCESSQGKRIQERKCDTLKKPVSIKHCQSAACPTATWRTGAWGECSVSCGRGKQRRAVACQTMTGEESTSCDNRTTPQNIQECHSPCNHHSPSDCQDINRTGYCPLVVKFKFCDRTSFHQLCCRTCTDAGL